MHVSSFSKQYFKCWFWPDEGLNSHTFDETHFPYRPSWVLNRNKGLWRPNRLLENLFEARKTHANKQTWLSLIWLNIQELSSLWYLSVTGAASYRINIGSTMLDLNCWQCQCLRIPHHQSVWASFSIVVRISVWRVTRIPSWWWWRIPLDVVAIWVTDKISNQRLPCTWPPKNLTPKVQNHIDKTELHCMQNCYSHRLFTIFFSHLFKWWNGRFVASLFA